MLKTKSEIKAKLEDAENMFSGSEVVEQERLSVVIITLRWVLGVKTTQQPKDPVSEE